MSTTETKHDEMTGIPADPEDALVRDWQTDQFGTSSYDAPLNTTERSKEIFTEAMKRLGIVPPDSWEQRKTSLSAPAKNLGIVSPDSWEQQQTSLSAPALLGIVRDSNCVPKKKSGATEEELAAALVRQQKLAERASVQMKRDSLISKLSDAPENPSEQDVSANASVELSKKPIILAPVGTAGLGNDSTGALAIMRTDEWGIAKQYFINTLCNVMNIDTNLFPIGPHDSIPTIVRAAVQMPRENRRRFSVTGPAGIAYLKAKLAGEFGIDPELVELMHASSSSASDFINAVIEYADENPHALTRERVAKNLTSAWGFNGDEVKDEPVKDSIRVTGSNAHARPTLRPILRPMPRHIHWTDRVTSAKVPRREEFVDPSDCGSCCLPLPRARAIADPPTMRILPACPLDAPLTHPLEQQKPFGDSWPEFVGRGINSASKISEALGYGKLCAADDWKKQISASFPGIPLVSNVPSVSLNNFAAQVSDALRVLPFPPKEVSFSMTLKA